MKSRFQDLSAGRVQLRPPSLVNSAPRVSRRTLLLSGAALVAVVPAAGAQQLSETAPQTPRRTGRHWRPELGMMARELRRSYIPTIFTAGIFRSK